MIHEPDLSGAEIVDRAHAEIELALLRLFADCRIVSRQQKTPGRPVTMYALAEDEFCPGEIDLPQGRQEPALE